MIEISEKKLKDEWGNICKKVWHASEVSELSYHCMLRPLEILRYQDGVLTILVGSEAVLKYVEHKYGKIIQEILREETGVEMKLFFTMKKREENNG